jgi:hypothetical protein
VRKAPLLVLAAVLAALPVAAGATNGSWLEFYDDTPNDAASGPDIYRLLVGNSDKGFVSFEVDAKLKATKTVTLFVDTDAATSTGDPANGGADLRLDITAAGRKRELFGWRSGRWLTVLPPSASVHDTVYGVDLFIDRSDLGHSDRVDLWAESTGNGNDRMPDRGVIHYDLRPLRLTVARFEATTTRLAERLELTIRRSDSGGYLTGDLPLCSAHVGGKPVFAKLLDQARKQSPAAYCLWRFPASLRGRKARATITIEDAGRTVTRSAAFVVR